MTEETINLALFFILAATMIVGAIAFLVAKNIVHSVLWFLLSLLGVAGAFFFLRAPFLGATQILIYAGAITVLFLFVVMLTMTRMPEVRVFGSTQVSTPLLAALAFLLLITTLIGAGAWLQVGSEPQPEAGTTLTAALGDVIYRQYLLPFELAAFVLLIALIGAIFFASERGRKE